MDDNRSERCVRWSVGVITAPRQKGYYLDRTLESLKNAGWEAVVFAEPGSIVPSSWQTVSRRKQFGDWSNWACGLYELLLTEPESDYFFMAEDDVVLWNGSKKYLEQWLPLLEPFGAVSIYCPQQYYQKKFVGFHNECHDWRTCTTQTVIMSRDSVISFFSDPLVQRHRFEHTLPIPAEKVPWGVEVDPKNSVKDAVIGMWAARNKLPIYFHSPSLGQHIGEHSTLTSKAAHTATDFVDEDCQSAINPLIRKFVQPPVF